MALTTKRLHISGITTNISQQDLQTRLSAFVDVKSLDGFGLRDGLGQPRTFVYATVQGSSKDLKKCVSTLSGSTWKGAKLRVGDARPDFATKLTAERDMGSESPKKRLRRRSLKYAATYAADMSLVTPANVSSRPGWKVTSTGRLLRPMRMRPARPLPSPLDVAVQKKKRNKTKNPPIRARRKNIDVTRWGGERLSGIFLNTVILNPDVPISQPSKQPPTKQRAPIPTSSPFIGAVPDLNTEAQKSLQLLGDLFGGLDADENHWIGKESVDSDLELEDPSDQLQVGEVATRDKQQLPTNNVLQDIFAPQEEVGFSLVDHLGLELDESSPELDSMAAATVFPEPPPDMAAALPIMTDATFTLNSRQSRFFPDIQGDASLLDFPSRGRTFDFFSVDKDEEIERRWEESRVELTRGWKKRWREAGKNQRRLGITLEP